MEDAIKEYKIEKFNDQFSGSTRTVRRNLLAASCVALVLSVDGLKFNTFFGLDLKDESSVTLTVGAVSMVAAYELASFIVYAMIDHKAWVIKANSVVHRYSASGLREIASQAGQTREQLSFIRGKMTSDDDSVVAAIKSQSGVIDRICEKAEEVISQYQASVKSLNSEIRSFNALQLFRIYLVDWGIPLAVGGFCMYRNYFSAWAFIQAVVR